MFVLQQKLKKDFAEFNIIDILMKSPIFFRLILSICQLTMRVQCLRQRGYVNSIFKKSQL